MYPFERRANMKNTRLEAARRSLGLTQAQIAAKAGMSRSFYAGIENGFRQPGLSGARKLSDITGVPMEFFLKPDVSSGDNRRASG
jgi:transcriptional regulator with XRE-family HTH domain